MKYYISDTPLKLREFGRNVQAMIEYALGVEDRAKRSQIAREIVRIMINLNPSLTENPDYKQKLWDALFIISDFQLDVDSPYPPPEKENTQMHLGPRMEYYEGRPRYRQYGRNVELMIEQAVDMEDGPKRDAYVNLIASTMKQFLRNMERDGVSEETIAEHLRDLSSNRIKVKAEDLTFHKLASTNSSHPHQNPNGNNRSKNKSKNKRSRGKRSKRSR